MRMIAACLILMFVGCGVQPTSTDPMPTNMSTKRLELIDRYEEDGWKWKVMRDAETEKEWVVIHDSYRMIVMPIDSNHPVSIE